MCYHSRTLAGTIGIMVSRRSPITVRPAMLIWARERAGLRTGELARKVNVKPERVLAWERSGRITMPQAERLAHVTHTPFGYLFLSNPPDEALPIPDFRARGDAPPSRPSPDLLETIFSMQRRQAWMREELVEGGTEPLEFVGAYHANGNAPAIAWAIRDALNLEYGWAELEPNWSQALRRLRDSAEDAGILIFFNGVVGNNTSRKLDPNEFQGFALVDEYAPLIFVNNADFKAAQMFTLAHELAHLLIGETGVSGFNDMEPAPNAIERFCDSAAAEFLVPGDELQTFWVSEDWTDPYQAAARHFKVSSIVTARRALDLGLIDRDAFFSFYYANRSRGTASIESTGGGDFWNTQRWRIGHRFPAAVLRAVKGGRLNRLEAYSLTGLSGETFAKLPEKIGIQA